MSTTQVRAGLVTVATAPNVVSAFGHRRRQHRSLAHDAWRRFHRHRLAVVGGLVYASLG